MHLALPFADELRSSFELSVSIQGPWRAASLQQFLVFRRKSTKPVGLQLVGKGAAQQIQAKTRWRRAPERLLVSGFQIGVIKRFNLGEQFLELRLGHTPLTLAGGAKSSALPE